MRSVFEAERGISREEEELLAAFRLHVQPRYADFAAGVAERLVDHPGEARSALEAELAAWLRALFTRSDEKGALPPPRFTCSGRLLVAAVYLLRREIAELASRTYTSASELERAHRAIERAIAAQLGTIIDMERQAHDATVRAHHAERLAALGVLAAALAHEIRNPLNAAQLQLTLVKRRLGHAPPDVTGALDATSLAVDEMKRLADLVTETLQFARPQPLRVSETDLRAGAVAVVERLRGQASALGCALALADGDPVVSVVDVIRMREVMLQLAKNGLEAAASGGSVTLAVTATPSGPRIDVVDDGAGLPAPDAPIFEPFYTTKENRTGLGLSFVHRVVHDHEGHVQVTSRPGLTIFSVHLPVRR